MKKIFILFAFLNTFLLIAQHNNDVSFKNIPPSPIATKYAQYLGSEPNMTNGNVSIPIEIFDINLHNYTLPIKLVYSTPGISIMDSPLPLGYGWSLNINPRVNRTVLGRPDEDYKFKNSYDPNQSDWDSRIPGATNGNFPDYYEPLKGVLRSDGTLTNYQLKQEDLYDSQKDVFTIQLPQKSVSFILKRTGTTLTAYSLGNQVKIDLNVASNYIKGIKITDEDGVVYRFGNYDNETGNDYFEEYDGSRNSWLLRSIELLNLERINFSWVKNNVSSYKPSTSVSVGVDDYKNDHLPGQSGTPSSDPEVNDYGGLINISEYSNPFAYMLKQITFPNGKIEFLYKSTTEPFMSRIEVKNNANRVIRNVQLNYGTKNSSMEHYLLKNVIVNGDKFVFTYNSNFFTQASNSLDYWGFYNAKQQATQIPRVLLKYYWNYSAITTSIPTNSSLYVGVANKGVDSLAMKAFMLEKVTYPTGGYTQYEYEPHQFSYSEDYPGFQQIPATINYGGGLRVRKIKNYDHTGVLVLEKIYKYGVNQNGLANIKLIPTLNTFIDETFHWTYYSTITLSNRNVRIKPLTDYNSYDFGRSGFWYEEVSEYIKDQKRTFKYILKEDETTFMSSFKMFNKKYTSTVFTLFQNGPQLSEEINYKKINNLYTLLTKKEYIYDWIEDLDNNISNLIFNRRITVSYVGGQGSGIDPIYPYNATLMPSGSAFDGSSLRFNIGTYTIKPGFYRLSHTINKEYAEAGEISNTIFYDYSEGKNTYVKSMRTTGSNGLNNNIKSFKYVWESTLALHQIMTQKNLLNQVLEDKFTTNQSVTLHENLFTNENAITNGLILIKNKNVLINNKTSKSLQYNLYDKYGNLLEIKTQNGMYVSYLYGYGGQYLIAEIRNASRAQILTALGTTNQNILNELNNKIVPDDLIINTMNTLRNALPLAQVTSFTYTPLVGMTSKVDSRGIKETYIYDHLSRLIAVLDFNGNVLKTICYNNKGEQVDCFGNITVYSNVSKSKIYTKNDCVSGLGGSINYVVPAAKYTSTISQIDADNQAQLDVDLNGQAYANANAGCEVSVNYVNVEIQRQSGWEGKILRIRFYQNSTFPSLEIIPQNTGTSEIITIPEGEYSQIKFDVDATGTSYNGFLSVVSANPTTCEDLGYSIKEFSLNNAKFNSHGNKLIVIAEYCL